MTVTKEIMQDLINDIKKGPYTIIAVRRKVFKRLRLNDFVPADLCETMYKIITLFYDKNGLGYDGIMQEIRDRMDLYILIDGGMIVKDFMKHKPEKTDIYDKENKISYEKKTGCGDWLRSEKYVDFNDIIAEYKRKKTRIRWDYDFIPSSDTMTGIKSMKDNAIPNKNDKQPAKQYEIHIHIDTTYKKLFEYMETYPKGIQSFFKLSVRSIAGVTVYQMQSIKNSKRKVEFLQAFKG